LELTADRIRILADGKDLSFITARIVDADGQIAPRAKGLLRFSVTGAGEIVASDNGDPTSFIPFQSHERPAFNGLALVIVRARLNADGPITVRVDGDGIEPASIRLESSNLER
jgi:beta-galactosidase